MSLEMFFLNAFQVLNAFPGKLSVNQKNRLWDIGFVLYF